MGCQVLHSRSGSSPQLSQDGVTGCLLGKEGSLLVNSRPFLAQPYTRIDGLHLRLPCLSCILCPMQCIRHGATIRCFVFLLGFTYLHRHGNGFDAETSVSSLACPCVEFVRLTSGISTHCLSPARVLPLAPNVRSCLSSSPISILFRWTKKTVRPAAFIRDRAFS